MILIILAIWFGYKKARATGRNPWLWAAISGAVFIGTQLMVGVAFGVVIALGIQFLGWRQDTMDKFAILANIPAIVLSILALWLVFRFLDRRPTEDVTALPPPPPTFGDQI